MQKLLCLLLAVFSLSILYAQRSPYNVLSHDNDSFGIVEIRQGNYPLINPLLDCYQVTPPGLRQMKQIEKAVSEYIETAKKDQRAVNISIYYRDLSNGPWLGINEEEMYAPASLLKLPILIAALKYTESNPGFLSLAYNYQGPAVNIRQNIQSNALQPGTTYSMKELIERMIIYSDNEAKELVSSQLPGKLLNQVVYDLGIDTRPLSYTENFMSAKGFAGFFRVLYNATFLSPKMSELALSIMSRSDYKNGIVAGLPDGVTVSHKFGERSIPDTNIRQLHDCGIIYKENQPYLLCVMTQGTDFKELEQVIADISMIIYENLKSNL